MSFIRQSALSFLASQHIVTLATVGANGLEVTPFPCTLADDFDLWVIADRNQAQGKTLESATDAAGIFRSDVQADSNEVELRVEGSLERVEGLAEQAKALSTFLVRNIPLPKGILRNGDSQVLAVYRLRPHRVHFTDRSLLKHTVVFHFEKQPALQPPARPERRKAASRRSQKQVPAPLRDRPTLRDVYEVSKHKSLQPPS